MMGIAIAVRLCLPISLFLLIIVRFGVSRSGGKWSWFLVARLKLATMQKNPVANNGNCITSNNSSDAT